MQALQSAFGRAVLAGIGIFVLAGCGNQSQEVTKPISPETQIQEIQNNTHMPAQAKAAAIAQIKAQTAVAASKGNSPK